MMSHNLLVLTSLVAFNIGGPMADVAAWTPSLNTQGSTASSSSISSSTRLQMGIFDDLQLIFSDEGKKNRAAYEDRERSEQEAAQKEILERRRNPNIMDDYNQNVATKRQQLQEDRDVWDFQNKIEEGYDPLNQWNKLRDEGKIKTGSQLERDPQSSRLGSEGLVEVRTDELLPYIDQGYVDDDADVMGNFMNIFGGGKKKD